MKAFVAGATGRTGKCIVEELVRRDIPVVALVRNREKGQQLLPPGVELVTGDVLKPEGIKDSLASCDVIFCATGATPSFDFTGPYQVDYQGTKNLVDLAKSQGIQQFVLISSLCVSRFMHPLNLFWLVLYWKQQGEAYLQASGVPYTIVRPGGLKDGDNTDGIVMQGADTLFEGSIPRAKVASVAVESLFQSQAKNKILEIVTSPQASTQNWGELFSKV